MIIARYEIKKQNIRSYILTNKQLDLDEKLKAILTFIKSLWYCFIGGNDV